MIFNKYTAQQVSNLLTNNSNFSFIIPISDTLHIENNITQNTKVLIPISGVTETILAHLHFSGNSQINNLDIVTSYTAFQGGRIYFTYINTNDCQIEIEY